MNIDIGKAFTGISLRTWLTLALMATMVGYHLWKIHGAKEEVRSEMQATIDNQVKDQVIAGLGKYIKVQDHLSSAGNAEKVSFAKDLAHIQSMVSSLQQDYHAHASSDPIPPGCYLDPYRVRFINQALHPTGQP